MGLHFFFFTTWNLSVEKKISDMLTMAYGCLGIGLDQDYRIMPCEVIIKSSIFRYQQNGKNYNFNDYLSKPICTQNNNNTL